MSDQWKYREGFRQDYAEPDYDDHAWLVVDIPHNPSPVGFHYFDERQLWKECTYRRHVFLPAQNPESERVIRFEGVGVKATVFFDGEQLAVHEGAYTPFEVAIPRDEGMLVLKVEMAEDPLIPPFGSAIDYLVFGGIYRPVSFFVRPVSHLGLFAVSSLDGKTVSVRLEANGEGLVQLRLKDGGILLAQQVVTLENGKATANMTGLSLRLWDVKEPNLYQMEATYGQEVRLVTFGARKAEFSFNGFFLNGRCIKLIGLDRHQCYPYVGYAMPDENQAHDAAVLKDMGLNIVRTSHYPDSPAFLDACDKEGLLVLEEIPGWQYISDDPHWRDLCVKNVHDMVQRDINHPSIVLWGVRINESQDDDELYRKTNDEAHGLDPTRQTCGVRNFLESNLLEDVFTYNDFSHDGKKGGLVAPRVNAPYLVTEHNGHMFPTKRFDCQSIRTGQFLRHMAVLESAFASDRISGAIGWCFADYQTHSNFGSGDGLCHHGVCDQHRMPKFAAYAYISQQEKYPVLVSSQTFDPGDVPETKDLPWIVATNCDSVNLYCDRQLVGTFYPARASYPHVPHPPVIIDDFVGSLTGGTTNFSKEEQKILIRLINKSKQAGQSFSPVDQLQLSTVLRHHHMDRKQMVALFDTYTGLSRQRKAEWRLEGVIGGKVVASEVYGPDQKRVVTLKAERTEVPLGGSYHVIPVILSIGREGMTMPLPYAFEPYCVETEGPITLISPAMDCTMGGVGGIYVRTTGEKGKGVVRVRLQDEMVQQEVVLA